MGISNIVCASNGYNAQNAEQTDSRSSEQIMVDLIREDLGVTIEPQAWRMFIRHRFGRISPLAHRIHDGKR
jgi:hypothetical protein